MKYPFRLLASGMLASLFALSAHAANCSFTATSPIAVPVGTAVTNAYLGIPNVSGAPTKKTKATVSVNTVNGGTVTIGSTTQFTYTSPASQTSPTDSFTLSLSCADGTKMTLVIDVNITGLVTTTPTTPPATGGITPTPVASLPVTIAGANGASGTVSGTGSIIIDNTPNPGTPGISANMSITGGGTTIGSTPCSGTKQYGVCNSFSQASIQVMQRVTFAPKLVDEIGLTQNTCNGVCDTSMACTGSALDPVTGLKILDAFGKTIPATGVCSSTQAGNFGNVNKRTNYFANGQHLFDLDRLRTAANYLYDYRTGTSGAGVIPNATHPAGTYGTISWAQFLGNLAAARPMYGITRVLIPLQLGTAAGTSCTGGPVGFATGIKNAVYKTVYMDVNGVQQTHLECVPAATVFGFCKTLSAASMCNSAPGTGGTTIGAGSTMSGVAMPSTGTLVVYGSLLFDYVADQNYPTLFHTTAGLNYAKGAAYKQGDAIDLDHLHFDAKAFTYIKVQVPINVNPSNDHCVNTGAVIANYAACTASATGDGAMDNMEYIDSLTAKTGTTTGKYAFSSTIDYAQVPQEAKDSYQFEFNKPLTAAEFATLDLANQYHLLMPSGYEAGWVKAFNELGLTAATWSSQSMVGSDNTGAARPVFKTPAASAANGILTINEVRGNVFEDIPVYLYSGGLVDMHYHTNISGLVYVPQSLELEARNESSGKGTGPGGGNLALNGRQYVSGAVVMRDGFYIESSSGAPSTITVFSSNPQSISNIRVLVHSAAYTLTATTTSSGGGRLGGATGVGLPGGTGGTTGGTPCVGCGGSGGGSGGGGATNLNPGENQWIFIQPK